jgi:hypothetical protein
MGNAVKYDDASRWECIRSEKDVATPPSVTQERLIVDECYPDMVLGSESIVGHCGEIFCYLDMWM